MCRRHVSFERTESVTLLLRKAGTFLSRFLALALCALTLVLAGTANARQTGPSSQRISALSCAGAVNWRNAGSYIGRFTTIRGPVAGTTYASSSNGSPTFLNVGRDYPASPRFTVVIWGSSRSNFGAPERRYRGKTICVRGRVSSYAGVPEISATSPAQITIQG